MATGTLTVAFAVGAALRDYEPQLILAAFALSAILLLVHLRRRERSGKAVASDVGQSRRLWRSKTAALVELDARLEGALKTLTDQEQAIHELEQALHWLATEGREQSGSLERRLGDLETQKQHGLERLRAQRDGQRASLDRVKAALELHNRELHALEQTLNATAPAGASRSWQNAAEASEAVPPAPEPSSLTCSMRTTLPARRSPVERLSATGDERPRRQALLCRSSHGSRRLSAKVV